MAGVIPGRVSVVIPTRNSAATLKTLLESVRGQTYEDVETIVVDNGSSDDTQSIAGALADAVLTRGPERSAQRNFGVEHATGEFVLVLDSDMVLEPGVIEACVLRQRETGASALVVPERTVGDGWLARVRALERSCYVGDESVEAARFFTVDAFRRYDGYDTEFTGVEDWDLPARMRDGGEVTDRIVGPFIDHDESDIRLGAHLRKKFYYAQTALPYLRRHKRLASRQVVLLRPAFARHSGRLARSPFLTAGLVALKLAEGAAGVAGVAVALRRPPRRS